MCETPRYDDWCYANLVYTFGWCRGGEEDQFENGNHIEILTDYDDDEYGSPVMQGRIQDLCRDESGSLKLAPLLGHRVAKNLTILRGLEQEENNGLLPQNWRSLGFDESEDDEDEDDF